MKPILSIRDGEVMPVKRVRGNRKAFQEFVDALETKTTRRAGAARRHRARRRAGAAWSSSRRWCATSARRRRSRWRRSLGAVIGAHAGPGTVGFFWFTDPD